MFENLKIQDYQNLYRVRENTPEYSYLTLYLNFVKTYLKSRGLGFQEGAETITKFAVNANQTIFSLPYFNSLDNLTYKTEYEEQGLVLDTDYTRQGKKGLYFNEIRLLKYCYVFSANKMLKITANWGFETIPDDFHFVFLNLFGEALNAFKYSLSKQSSDGKDLENLRVGDITYRFSENQTSNNFTSIFDKSSDLQKVISFYV